MIPIRLDLTTEKHTVSDRAVRISGVFINKDIVYAVQFYNGASELHIVPAGMSAGEFMDFDNAEYRDGCNLSANASETGEIVVTYEEQVR